MKLYYDPITVNCRKVLAGFDLMGTKFESIKMNYFGQDYNKPEYLEINPNASLPSLVDGDFVLWESNAILQYAAEKDGVNEVYPKEVKTRADINRWLLWECNQWFPSCYTYLVENLVKPLTGGKTDPAVLEGEGPRFHKLAAILEQRLAKQPWLAGNNATIADIAVAAPMHLHPWQKLPLERYASLRRWIGQVEALPCWKNTDPVPLLGLK
jgi:glutathione S-transferase